MLNNNLLNNARTPSLNSVNTNITSQEVIQTIKTSINSTKNIRRYSNKVENRWWDKSSKAMPAPSTQRMMYLEKYYSTSVEARQMFNYLNTMQKLNHKQKKFYSSFSSGYFPLLNEAKSLLDSNKINKSLYSTSSVYTASRLFYITKIRIWS